MQSQPCTPSTGGSPSSALPNSVDIHAIDGQRTDAVLSNIDLEKGGQQGSLIAAL